MLQKGHSVAAVAAVKNAVTVTAVPVAVTLPVLLLPQLYPSWPLKAASG